MSSSTNLQVFPKSGAKGSSSFSLLKTQETFINLTVANGKSGSVHILTDDAEFLLAIAAEATKAAHALMREQAAEGAANKARAEIIAREADVERARQEAESDHEHERRHGVGELPVLAHDEEGVLRPYGDSATCHTAVADPPLPF